MASCQMIIFQTILCAFTLWNAVAHGYNNTILSGWTSTEIIDLNLQKSKAIYSTISSVGVWIFGGIEKDGVTISNSITFLNFATDDTTIYDNFLDNQADILPFPMFCKSQCSTTVNFNDIVIVSPYTTNNDIIYDLWVFYSSESEITVTSKNVSMVIEVVDACITSSMSESTVWIIGGMDKNGNILDIIQKYDIETNEWIQLNNTMNIARMSASCNIYNNKLYVFGGTINYENDTNTIEYYDIINYNNSDHDHEDEWILLSVNDSTSLLSSKTHDHHAILVDNIIFNIGGYDIDSYIMDAFVITSTSNTDIFAQTMTNLTHLYGVICINDIQRRFFLLSGENDALNTLNTIEMMEYSNKLNDDIEFNYFEPTSAPTSSPTAAPTGWEDVAKDKVIEILNSKFFDPNTWSTFTIVVVIIALTLTFISCLAFCQHKCRCNLCGCRGADDVEWWRLFRYSLQVYDLFTDINFSATLWMEWSRWRIELIEVDAYDIDDVNVNKQTTYYFYAAILSSVFLVLPYFCNLLFVLCPCGLPSLLSQPSYAEAKMWMIARAKLFAMLVLLSGGAFASLTLVNSKMFGLSLFTMGLSRRQLLQFTDIQVKLSILLENIPQLCLQLSVIFNKYLHPDIYNGNVLDMVTGMSLVSSAFLIIIGLISTCIIKSQIIDDLEITIDVTATEVNKKIIKKIHACLGLRNSIGRELSLVFGVHEYVIEVPRINRTMYGCKIRLYIAKTDTLQTLKDLQKKTNDIAKVLSLLFRVDVNKISVYLVATSSDVIDNVTMVSSNNLAINMEEMRQLSNNTDYCNPRLDEDDKLVSNDSDSDDQKDQDR